MTLEERTHLANLLLPDITKTKADYETMYPKRQINSDGIVTRFAPSPTGFIHMGSLYATFVESTFARQTNGLFYLRIEDTDHKREVENGISMIIDDLKHLEIYPLEGPEIGGNYGPYIQSERKEIYQTYIKQLLMDDLAYPCFCSAESLDEIRQMQEVSKDRIGYHGVYAQCRNLSYLEILEKIEKKEPWIIRLKSPGNFNHKVVVEDAIKGRIEFPENDMDIVIMKSDGLPTYHFAHAIDDHLMRTTHVIRGDEWVSSLPVHIQLFQVLGFDLPCYAHLAPLTKKEDNGIRKLSKRKDPEAAVQYYYEKGIPLMAIKLYLATLINSNFESWYMEDPKRTIEEFVFEFDKMSVGGALFDLAKLENIAKLYFSRLKATEIYEKALPYFKEYDMEFYEVLCRHKDFTIGMLNIEREIERPRKDIACYQDIKTEFWYFYEEYFDKKTDAELYGDDFIGDAGLLESYLTVYQEKDDKESWFERIKEFASEHGYAREVKEYKQNKEAYLGHVGDICQMIRLSVTTKKMTPDLYEIMQLLGRETVEKRCKRFINFLRK